LKYTRFLGYTVASSQKKQSKNKAIMCGTATHVVFPCRRHQNKRVKPKFEKEKRERDGKFEIINCALVRSLIKKGMGG